MKRGIRINALLLMVVGAALAWVYPRLPEPMASHFTMDGTPDRWSSRSSFAASMAGMAVLMNAIVLGLVPWVTRRAPRRLLNLPYRDYWCATPERRLEAVQKTDVAMVWTAAFMNVLLLLSLHMVAQANGVQVLFRLEPPLDGFALVGFAAVFSVGMPVWLWRAFRPPGPESRAAAPDQGVRPT